MDVDEMEGASGPGAAIRVFVVDDHPMVRLGVAALLQSGRGLFCVGEAGDGDEALSRAPSVSPHVVVMDIDMPRMDGITAMQALRLRLPAARFVMLGSDITPRERRRAWAAGASAVLSKSASALEVVQAIRAAHEGHQALPPLRPAQPDVAPIGVGDNLTQRERDLLALMARGYSNQEICLALGIALPTAKYHVTHILTKLGATNRTEAVLVALRHELVELEPLAPR